MINLEEKNNEWKMRKSNYFWGKGRVFESIHAYYIVFLIAHT